MKQWLPLKIVLICGLFMLIQYFVPRDESDFLYEYALDFTIIIGIFALALGIWSLIWVSYEKIKRRLPGWGYAWVILIGLFMMVFFGFFPTKVGNVGNSPSGVSLADIDFDNDNDAIVTNYETGNISIFKNGGNFAFVSAYTFPAGETPSAVAAVDVDGDNDRDIVVANDSAGTISVLMNVAKPGDFKRSGLRITAAKSVDSVFNVGRPRFAKPQAYPVGIGPVALAVGDLNGDGIANDLAVANSGSSNISVLLNDGKGSFAVAVNYPTGASPVALYIADVDRDLINDIVVANAESQDVAFLKGDGRGGFQAAGSLEVKGGLLTGIVTGDFDGNGYLDLAVTACDDAGNGHLHIFKSDSSAVFATAEDIPTGRKPVGLTAADLDGDNKRELLVVCQGENSVKIHRYDGSGSFPIAGTFSAGRQPTSLAAGIMDNSNRPSIAVTSIVNNSTSIFANKGNLGFELGANLRSGTILFLGGAITNYFYVNMFNSVVIPVQSTMFALLAFYISSAAYRAFRARSLLATILLVAALIIMIRFIPLGPISDAVSQVAGWILKIPNMAAKRAIMIGIGLGSVATAIKVVLGIERTYMGRD